MCHTFCNHIFPPSCKNARVNFTRIYPVFNENIPFFFSTEIKNKKRKGKFHPFRPKMGKKTKRERDLKSGSTVKFVFKIVFFFFFDPNTMKTTFSKLKDLQIIIASTTKRV